MKTAQTEKTVLRDNNIWSGNGSSCLNSHLFWLQLNCGVFKSVSQSSKGKTLNSFRLAQDTVEVSFVLKLCLRVYSLIFLRFAVNVNEFSVVIIWAQSIQKGNIECHGKRCHNHINPHFFAEWFQKPERGWLLSLRDLHHKEKCFNEISRHATDRTSQSGFYNAGNRNLINHDLISFTREKLVFVYVPS